MLNKRIKHCLLNNVNLHFEGCELWLVVLEADNVRNTRLHLVAVFLCALPHLAHPKDCSWYQGLTSRQCGLQPLHVEQPSTAVTASSRQIQTFFPALQGTLTTGKQMHACTAPCQTDRWYWQAWMEASKRPWHSCGELHAGGLCKTTPFCFNFQLIETPPNTWHTLLQFS